MDDSILILVSESGLQKLVNKNVNIGNKRSEFKHNTTETMILSYRIVISK